MCCVPSAGMCVKCTGGVYGADQACQAMGQVYHDSCFTCCACGKTAAHVSVQMHGHITQGWWHEYIHTKHISAPWHSTIFILQKQVRGKKYTGMLLHSPRKLNSKETQMFLGGTQYFCEWMQSLSENAMERKCFCGKTVLLQENANVLQANAKFFALMP